MTLAVGSSSSFDLAERYDGTCEVTGDLSDTPVDDEVLVPVLRDAIQNALGGAQSAFCVRIEPRGDV